MSVSIDPERIRPHDGVLGVLRLGERRSAGAERVLELAKSAAPDAEARSLGDSATGLYVDDRLVAYADPDGPLSRSFPQLELLSPGDGLADRAARAAHELAEDDGLVPRDGTEFAVLDPTTLHGAAASRRRVTDPADYLATARIQRRIDGVPVVGDGSQATVSVSADGIESFAHNWRPADRVEEYSGADIDRRRVADAITESLAPVAEEKDVRVESVELVYYDGDNELIQPVYRFVAAVGDVNSARLVGYVPALEAFDRLPLTIQPQKLQPRATKAATAALTTRRAAAARPGLGRYVVRNDNAGWVESANDFLSGLRASAIFGGVSPVDRQYFWAYPRLYENENRSFVDSVHVTLTEGHGNWWLFTTEGDDTDIVRLADIPADGYGGAFDLGSLAHWVIHSCSVIPAPIDTSASFDVWWDIFRGLHSAVGYRTVMWINDRVTWRYGFFAGLGAPMVSNWLSTVIGDDSYSPTTFYTDSDHHNPARVLPHGRPSAVNVFGHADDTIRQTAPLGRPSVLQQWWYGN